MIYDKIVAGMWLVFLVYWLIAAFGAKKNARGVMRGIVARAVVATAIIVTLRSRPTHLDAANPLGGNVAALRIAGVALTGLGIAFAIWARIHIGKNWGMPMSVKVAPELVTTGPYAHVRHPIYTGAIVALFGTALASSVWWLVPFGLFSAYFIYSATREEQTMVREFPSQYPEYRKRTKMLIPFVF